MGRVAELESLGSYNSQKSMKITFMFRILIVGSLIIAVQYWRSSHGSPTARELLPFSLFVIGAAAFTLIGHRAGWLSLAASPTSRNFLATSSLREQLELDRPADSRPEALFRYAFPALFVLLPVLAIVQTLAAPASAFSLALSISITVIAGYALSYFVWRFLRHKVVRVAWWCSVALVAVVLTLAALTGQ